MPYTLEHKQQTRERILSSASRLFSRRGYDAVSIDDLMQDAGLTRGAFYNHFSDKADVYAHAIVHATVHSPLTQFNYNDIKGTAELSKLLDNYISRGHVDNADPPCPLAFLVTDVGVREPAVRAAYTRIYQNMLKLIKQGLTHDGPTNQNDNALALTAIMIGGVAIARALDCQTTGDQLLKSCRSATKKILGE